MQAFKFNITHLLILALLPAILLIEPHFRVVFRLYIKKIACLNIIVISKFVV